jgi:hypothetical protein
MNICPPVRARVAHERIGLALRASGAASPSASRWRACSARLSAFAVLVVPAAAQARLAADLALEERVPPLERILSIAREDNRVQDQLRALTKEIGPRLTGSKKFERAANWARDQFASWGLDARLEKWGEFPVGFDRGRSRGGMVSPAKIDYVFITSAWSAGTAGPERGAALLEPGTEDELAAIKDRLAGAWIVRSKLRGDMRTRNKLRDEMRSAGVAGFVSPGGEDGLLQMSGSQRIAMDKLPKFPEIRLRFDQHADLVKRLEASEPVELEFDVEHRFTAGPIDCVNVVADLRGAEWPDECVIVGGHLDSWDAAEGAQDNGTGAATTLEAARLLSAAHVRPRRTIRFILFGGEEEGLLGSLGYVKQHKDDLAKVSAVLIHDGGANHVSGIQPTYAMIEDFERVFAPLADIDATRPFRVHESLGLQNSGDSDHAPFISAGVPAFFWDQSEDGYDHVHHTQYDTFESVDPKEQQYSARAIAVGAYGLAELDHPIDRTDMKPIPKRRMGVQLDGVRVKQVFESGKAADSGWLAGDVILSIDGRDVAGQTEITDALQLGGPKKSFRIRRGDRTLDTVLDYSGESSEAERAARASRRDAYFESHPHR